MPKSALPARNLPLPGRLPSFLRGNWRTSSDPWPNGGYRISQADLAAQHQQQLDFWKLLNPLLIDFDDLLDAGKAPGFLAALRQRLALPALPQDAVPVMAGDSRSRNLWRKLRTRLQASNAPIINTTVGFKL